MGNTVGLQNRQVRRGANSARPQQSLRASQGALNSNSSNFGADLGGITAGIGGAIQLGNQFSQLASKGDDINTAAPQAQVDEYGAPVYNLNEFAQQANAIQPKGASEGDLFSSTLTGVTTGASVGGPVGAIVGGVVGLAGGLISGGAGASEMGRKKKLALANLRFAQKQYNDSKEYFNTQESAKSQYNDMVNPATRQNNLYQANNPYA